jgi:DNA-binding transcriptional LysR family regulator
MQDLNDIALFVAVVEQKGFSAASRALSLPKSTVSRHISHLEGRLGVRLLERSTRHFRVTDAGTAYYARCRAILADLESADQELAFLRNAPSGIVRISAPLGMSQFALARILPAFMARYPLVRVVVVASDRPMDLFEDRIDIAIRARTQLRDEMLTMRKLGKSFLVLVASPTFAAEHGITDDLQKITGLPFLSSRETVARQPWTLMHAATGQQETLSLEPRLFCSDFNVLREAAGAGLGIAILPIEAALPSISQGRLTRILPNWQSEDVTIHLVFTTRRSLTPAARLLIEHLAEHFELVFDR